MSAKLTIALTGGIGSGKSTVADMFADIGIPVIDSDLIARELVEPGTPAWHEIRNMFGEAILLANNHINRKELARLVFSDPVKKIWLEKLLHPVIYAEINRRIDGLNCPYCIIVIPLLVETGAIDSFSRVLVVDVPEVVQKSRTLLRDNSSEAEVDKVIASQAHRDERLEYADDVIINDSTHDELKKSVNALHKKYIELAATMQQQLSR